VRDYEEKRREYLELGVREYWIIDRFERRLTVFRRPPAEPAEQVCDEKAVYKTPLLPGFELPLGRLFDLADDWKKRRKKG
jgi:Uma2 family endonuclease